MYVHAIDITTEISILKLTVKNSLTALNIKKIEIAFIAVFLISILNGQFIVAQLKTNDIDSEVVLQNWFRVVEDASQNFDSLKYSSVYDQISDQFFELYRNSNNQTYLNYAINEAGSNQREIIKSKLSTRELEALRSTIDKIENRELSDDYFERDEFSPDDFYTFLRISLNDSLRNKAVQLLDKWRTDLPSAF